jgi:hypothetical protein
MNDANREWLNRLIDQDALPEKLQHRHQIEVEKMYIKKINIKNRLALGALVIFSAFLGLLFYMLMVKFVPGRIISGKFNAIVVLAAAGFGVTLVGIALLIWVIARGRYHIIWSYRALAFVAWALGIIILITIMAALDISWSLNQSKNISDDFFAPIIWLAIILFAFFFWGYFHLNTRIERKNLDLQRRLFELELRVEQFASPDSAFNSSQGPAVS